MTKRIFRSIFIVVLSVLMVSLVLIIWLLFNSFSADQMEQLRMQTDLAAQGVETEGQMYFSGFEPKNYRITWVSPEGEVLFDSDFDAAEMENHLEREEIQEAIASGAGESTRYSDTLTERQLYFAKRLGDGTVLRLSIAQSTVLSLVYEMAQPIIIIFVAAALLSLLLARYLSKKIVEPMNNLNLDDPLSNEEYDELSPLLRRIDSQQKQLREQAEKLQQKRVELETVTGNMNEGLLLISARGTLLSINRAAAKLFDADDSSVGSDILTLNRSLEMQALLGEVLSGRHSEKTVELKGGKYQLNASPVLSDEGVSGAAILAFDVTEKEKSEQIRREFTANVSHELKTPLHSISGYAELIQNGLVKQEDIVPFAGKIYAEAQRMICLVEDIIKLSRLDEGAEGMQTEDVNLYSAAEKTLHSLAQAAEKAEIDIELSGDSVTVIGIPQLIDSMIYNICDNAIKYNRKNGNVNISVVDEGETALLRVSDTGIGIPPEHKDRIFERFYRVDKSHSKDVGGTGLGLSIVKHAAKVLGAEISLESAAGKGTTVEVRFRK
ncbi:MAG: ATP-binding protein [Oscillospiraceae bacterium]